MGKKRSGGEATPPPARPFHDAFAKLRERLPEGYAPPPPAAGIPPLHAKRGEGSGEGFPARAVVRLERKGRGGKEATIVEKLDLPAPALAAWLDAAKRALGCGGALEGAALVLQGDQRDRIARWLDQRGVRKVTVGT